MCIIASLYSELQRTIKIASVIAMLVKPLIAIITIILSYAVHQPLPSVIIFYSSAIVVLAVRLIFYFYFSKSVNYNSLILCNH